MASFDTNSHPQATMKG